ncbi:putative component of NuA3 histone acetyltransferase complex [Pseudogymnoascus australis]
MKRKSEAIEGARNGILKSAKQKRAKESKPVDITGSFRDGLFDAKNLKSYTHEYAASAPYKHAVIHDLMNDSLLRAVRTEVRENVHFTPKETDIYKIHQSGDLANLDGLDDAALERLPSLLKLRDALYSPAFRKYAEAITGAGALSGKKTDMAINVYTPGCHLLCHDDVIGSRRISYILYLPDPDIPWKEEWGGALRLYPTTKLPGGDGEVTTVPSADFAKSIPPAWNQLSFFAVQPGLSFHDVEEVYHAPTAAQQEKEGGRVRMAISGWFHIPQESEEGYVPGAEETLALKSSLVQLQGKADEYDFPKETPHPIPAAEPAPSPSDDDDEGLEAEDIDFLLKYLTPTYLTPDTIEQVNAHFQENSAVSIDQILSAKFSARLRAHLDTAEASPLPATAAEIEASSPWRVAKPPHKHRFLYLEPSTAAAPRGGEEEHKNPVQELVDDLLPSREFRKWLAIATGCGIRDFNVLGRRFRRGKDYALATSHEGEPRLEVCLAFTPTKGWGVDDDEEEEEEEEEPKEEVAAKGKKGKKAAAAAKAKADAAKAAKAAAAAEEDDVGGHEVYMAAEDDDDSADAAIYKATTGDEEDNVLFTVPAAWNKMSIVLRDEGVLRFVKYVSRNAKGDRWDVSGLYGVDDEDDDEDDEGEDEGDEDGVDDEDDEDEEDEEGSEEFEGFSD